MKNLHLLPLLLAAAPVVFATDGNTAMKEVPGAVTLIRPIAIETLAGLSFGTLVVDQHRFTAGAMLVHPDGGVSTDFSAGIWKFTGSGKPAPAPARFAVTGEEGYPFCFKSPLELDLLNKNGGRATLKVTVTTGQHTHGSISEEVRMGGLLTLLVPTPGFYTGTINATVNYL